jgi:serine/threonine-protein kinase
LGGRYRLIAAIGTGASGQVYLADDVVLRRRVAVKVLHPALAGDEGFLRRFRAEAQAAAALSHPNIMAVHDWGEEADGEPFLVLEYLGGGSLRAMLDRGHLLTPSQALLVGLETARALEYAHRRGFVHRDVKPANLLFGDDGRLRVADFGLARALAEAAWTEPSGAVLGTARYASPEQVRGERVDGKADVYALALVLVEAVTGEVPFTADTTIATLMARVDRPLVVPDGLGAMASSLERAGRPDPAERPDAGELAVSLLAAAEELPRPERLPLLGALTDDDVTVGRWSLPARNPLGRRAGGRRSAPTGPARPSTRSRSRRPGGAPS